jgi:hypothetical protein
MPAFYFNQTFKSRNPVTVQRVAKSDALQTT